MREVVDGVIEIPIGYVNAYAVVVDDGVVLVDTGIPGRAEKVARAVEAARRSIGEVHTILLTHWHPDHIAIHERTTAAVVALGGEAPALYYVTMPPGSMRSLVDAVAARTGAHAPRSCRCPARGWRRCSFRWSL